MNRFNNVIFGQKAFIIDSSGKVLIVKRSKADLYGNMWDVPWGKLEQEDSLFEAIAREIKEETGLELTNIISIITSSKFSGSMSDRPFIFRNIYLCKAEGHIKLSDEHSEYKWVDPQELFKFEFPPDQDLQAALKIIAGNKFDTIKVYPQLI